VSAARGAPRGADGREERGGSSCLGCLCCTSSSTTQSMGCVSIQRAEEAYHEHFLGVGAAADAQCERARCPHLAHPAAHACTTRLAVLLSPCVSPPLTSAPTAPPVYRERREYHHVWGDPASTTLLLLSTHIIRNGPVRGSDSQKGRV
jgi:hypothetical protein